MANIICFKQEKGLKNCSNRQLKVTAKHKIYPDGQKNVYLENRGGVGHCPMCSVCRWCIAEGLVRTTSSMGVVSSIPELALEAGDQTS